MRRCGHGVHCGRGREPTTSVGMGIVLLTGDGILYNTAGLNGKRKTSKQLHVIGDDDEECTRKPYRRSHVWIRREKESAKLFSPHPKPHLRFRSTTALVFCRDPYRIHPLSKVAASVRVTDRMGCRTSRYFVDRDLSLSDSLLLLLFLPPSLFPAFSL